MRVASADAPCRMTTGLGRRHGGRRWLSRRELITESEVSRSIHAGPEAHSACGEEAIACQRLVCCSSRFLRSLPLPSMRMRSFGPCHQRFGFWLGAWARAVALAWARAVALSCTGLAVPVWRRRGGPHRAAAGVGTSVNVGRANVSGAIPSCRRRYRRHQGAIFRPQVGKQISCNLSTPRAPSAYATARHDRPHRHPHKSTRPAPNGERTDASNGQSASSSAGPPTLCAVDRVEAYSLKHMQRRSLQGGELAGQ
jgi:hypothetical protein